MAARRGTRWLGACAAMLLLVPSAAGGTAPPDYGYDWATIGDAGNVGYNRPYGYDIQGRGSVGYRYRMAKTEVTAGDFIAFTGIEHPDEFRSVTRAHLIAWRSTLEARELAPATIRRKLAAISSLFDHLCNENAVAHNPVGGVKRPAADGNEGKTPALSDAQARALLKAPEGDSIKARRDRAILAIYLFHALRRSELAGLRICDLAERRGVMHFCVFGKGSKTRYVPVHPAALSALRDYLLAAGHGEDRWGAMFRPVSNNRSKNKAARLDAPITGDGVYKMLKKYAASAGIRVDGLCLHALRATAATNALEHQADIAFVQAGSDTPISPPPNSTTGEDHGRRILQLLRWITSIKHLS